MTMAGPLIGGRPRDRRRTRWVGVATLAVALPATALVHARADIVIDRIVAVVNGRPITLSDVTAAMRLGLVAAVPAGRRSSGPLDAIIDRELILAEVRRYEPPEPSPQQVQQRLQRVRDRFPSPEALQEAIVASAMTEARLEGWVSDDLRAEAYIAQRFASPTIPTGEELVRYYREHEAEFAQEGTLMPFDEVREAVRQRLLDEQRERLVTNWLVGLQRRAEILVFEAAGR